MLMRTALKRAKLQRRKDENIEPADPQSIRKPSSFINPKLFVSVCKDSGVIINREDEGGIQYRGYV